MRLSDLKWPEVAALSPDTPIVLPIAALEQHGRHLPVFTDTMLLEEIVRRVSVKMGERILFAPVLWLGNSDHHIDFPGTLSSAPRAYLDLLQAMADDFLRHGFKRIVFLNGHGGNDVPARQALFELRQRQRDRTDLLLALATYWNLADPSRLAKLGTRQSVMGHACEWETSMILRIAPHLVAPVQAIEPSLDPHAFEPGFRAWITRERSVAGHIGDPAAATPEKGEALFEVFTDGVVAWLSRVLDWDGKGWAG